MKMVSFACSPLEYFLQHSCVGVRSQAAPLHDKAHIIDSSLMYDSYQTTSINWSAQ